MAVRCSGNCRLLEQVGEKQDFECALTALALPHEDFLLDIVRVVRRDVGPQWSHDYRVTVTSVGNGFRRVYIGGPGHRWVVRCADDLARRGRGCERRPRRRPSARVAAEAASGEQCVAE